MRKRTLKSPKKLYTHDLVELPRESKGFNAWLAELKASVPEYLKERGNFSEQVARMRAWATEYGVTAHSEISGEDLTAESCAVMVMRYLSSCETGSFMAGDAADGEEVEQIAKDAALYGMKAMEAYMLGKSLELENETAEGAKWQRARDKSIETKEKNRKARAERFKKEQKVQMKDRYWSNWDDLARAIGDECGASADTVKRHLSNPLKIKPK